MDKSSQKLFLPILASLGTSNKLNGLESGHPLYIRPSPNPDLVDPCSNALTGQRTPRVHRVANIGSIPGTLVENGMDGLDLFYDATLCLLIWWKR